MSRPLAASGFLVLLLGLGAADAYVTQDRIALPEQDVENTMQGDVTPPPSEGGVRKQTGPDVRAVLAELALASQDATDPSIIRRIIPPPGAVETMILLKDGDRIGLLSYTDSPQVKTYFLALKEALGSSFSGEMSDLTDETQKRPGKPVRNFLTFKDPALSTERLVFIRVRERLYEFHVAEGKEDVIFLLVERLTD